MTPNAALENGLKAIEKRLAVKLAKELSRFTDVTIFVLNNLLVYQIKREKKTCSEW